MGNQLTIVREAEIKSFLKSLRVVCDAVSDTTEGLRGDYLVSRRDIIRRKKCEPYGKQEGQNGQFSDDAICVCG